jgi:hypothetical protein
MFFFIARNKRDDKKGLKIERESVCVCVFIVCVCVCIVCGWMDGWEDLR